MSGRQNRQRLRLMLLLIMTMTGRLNLTTVSLYNPPFSEFTFMGPFSTTSAGWDSVFAPINQVPLLKKRAVYNDLPRFAEPQKQAYSSLAHPLKTFSQNFSEHFFKNFPQNFFSPKLFSKPFPRTFPKTLPSCSNAPLSDGLTGCCSIIWSNWWSDIATDGMPLNSKPFPSAVLLLVMWIFFLESSRHPQRF